MGINLGERSWDLFNLSGDLSEGSDLGIWGINLGEGSVWDRDLGSVWGINLGEGSGINLGEGSGIWTWERDLEERDLGINLGSSEIWESTWERDLGPHRLGTNNRSGHVWAPANMRTLFSPSVYWPANR